MINAGQKLDEKTLQLITYLVAKHSNASVTAIMKLCYLIDLIHHNKYKKQISDFTYIRYHYGPFNNRVYSYLESLVNSGKSVESLAYSGFGDEYILYKPSDKDKDVMPTKVSAEEMETVVGVIDQVGAYGPAVLTKIAYGTKPLKSIGATLGGSEGIGRELDLSAK